MIKVLGPKEFHSLTKEEKLKVINVTSSSKTWSRALSPFLLGPVRLYGDYWSQNFENLYQYSKVYPEHVGKLNRPSEEYWKWAESGWNNPRGVRYPMGKGRKPLYTYWDGKELGYIEARTQIYIPLYSKAVRKTAAYQMLEREYYKNDRNLILFDFDAYDHVSLGMSLEDAIKCEDRKFGHGMVLAGMLEGVIE